MAKRPRTPGKALAAAERRLVGLAHPIAAILVTALLLVGGSVGYQSLRRLAENDVRVAHSHEVLRALDELAAALTLAESRARGYLITGDPHEIAPYRQAADSVTAKLESFRKLGRDESSHRMRLPVLSRLVAGRLGELERTVALRGNGFEEARAEVATQLGMATMNAIRDEIADRTRVERRTLLERQAESALSYRVAMSNGVVVVGIGLLMIAALSAFVRRDLRARAEIAGRLEEADRRKDEFLATLAHELRNPLAPLRTAAETLRLTGERRQPARRALEIVERQVEVMSRLVEDLLDVERIARGTVELKQETVDLVRLVRDTVEACAPLAGAARHETSLALPDAPVHVSGDPARLTQIFTNLLANAIKYSPDGGHIEVTVQATMGRAVVRVRDHGIGIPADMLDRVFDMYTQVEGASNRSQGGLGIGLSVARKLLALQGATIEAWSAGPGKGSEFTVRLRRVPAPERPLAVARAADRPGAPCPRRILVVDDDADASESLAGFLGMLGHEVRTAADGDSALETLKEFSPEIVLLDIGLPGISGYDLARRIRRDPTHAGVLLVAQTGWAREEDRRRAVEAGFDHHLAKPLDPRALESLIGSLAGPAA